MKFVSDLKDVFSSSKCGYKKYINSVKEYRCCHFQPLLFLLPRLPKIRLYYIILLITLPCSRLLGQPTKRNRRIIVLADVFPQLYKDQRRSTENVSHKSSDSDVSDVSAISRTSSASRLSSTSYMSIQSERPRGRFRCAHLHTHTNLVTLPFPSVLFLITVQYNKSHKMNLELWFDTHDRQGHACNGPPHAEEHQRKRRDLRHGARRRQPIGHGARERHQEAALEPQPARRRHPAVQTQPEHLATQPDGSEKRQHQPQPPHSRPL